MHPSSLPRSLARLPTPVQLLPRLSEALGVEVHVKRDDLTGFGVSGNKVRKLEFLLADALEKGADTLITCGGIQSNHCRATAIAARQLGLKPVLLLRGEDPGIPNGNLLLDRLVEAEMHWCTPEAYRHQRNELMERLADTVRARGGVPYVIPEGGSNARGAQGYIQAASELETAYSAQFVAVGSGGTLAGLAMAGMAGRVVGVAVCDDQAYFTDKVQQIAEEAGRRTGNDWSVDDRYKGPAYGVATPEIWADIRRAATLEGILTDPCYSGKALHALCEEARRGAVSGKVLLWHTGGAFALFGRGNEVVAP